MPPCPTCGQPQPWPKQNQYFHSSANPPWQGPASNEAAPFTEATKRSPARNASLGADVGVPLAQAIITAIIAALLGLLLMALFAWPWYAPLVIGLIVLALTWLFLLLDHRSLLWSVETIIGLDIDGDGQTGQPKALPAPTIRAEVKQGPRWQFADLPGPHPALRKFAIRLLADRVTFSERGAAACGYSVAWEALRDEFIRQEWAQWRRPNAPKQGVQLTPAGLALLQSIAETPTPEERALTQ